ncbi:unnamed protein product [Ilex paraguariensis]|uniref:Uncharacterized protein n=1 Tax=Ilex paraguariensis TaxID=185542 RepID=A0ABC8S0H9_9AQUA
MTQDHTPWQCLWSTLVVSASDLHCYRHFKAIGKLDERSTPRHELIFKILIIEIETLRMNYNFGAKFKGQKLSFYLIEPMVLLRDDSIVSKSFLFLWHILAK